MKKLYTLLLITIISTASQAQVVISQTYGGGGNTGATYSNDFIELFNRGNTPQNLLGWSVQYASAAGPTAPATWIKTLLPDFTLQPGQYFLIKQAAGATPSTELPTPDLDGLSATTGSDGMPLLTGIAMSGSNGKVILVNSDIAETTPNPSGPQIIDKVGYGATPVGFEGTGPTGTALTSSTSAQRNNAGCIDTDNNPTDFTSATPIARNSSTAINNCSLSVAQNEITGLSVHPNPVTNGALFITTDNNNDSKSVIVYDVLGKQVIKTIVTDQPINVAALNSGVYFVKITEAGKTATRKLVIK
jgi:Lamin Tail Domain/Secretion system C-terminal sorting domain